jgi:hypothetical protein
MGDGCAYSHRTSMSSCGHRCRMLLSQVHPGHGPHHVPNTRSSQQFVRQEVEDRRTRQQVSSITEDDTTDEEDLEDDKGVH